MRKKVSTSCVAYISKAKMLCIPTKFLKEYINYLPSNQVAYDNLTVWMKFKNEGLIPSLDAEVYRVQLGRQGLLPLRCKYSLEISFEKPFKTADTEGWEKVELRPDRRLSPPFYYLVFLSSLAFQFTLTSISRVEFYLFNTRVEMESNVKIFMLKETKDSVTGIVSNDVKRESNLSENLVKLPNLIKLPSDLDSEKTPSREEQNAEFLKEYNSRIKNYSKLVCEEISSRYSLTQLEAQTLIERQKKPKLLFLVEFESVSQGTFTYRWETAKHTNGVMHPEAIDDCTKSFLSKIYNPTSWKLKKVTSEAITFSH